MGDINRTVEIIFEGTDRISAVTKNVSDRLDNLSSSVGSATQPFADLADKVLIAEAALAALAVGGLAYAYKQSVQFESAVVELQKVIGDQVDALGEAQDAAFELSSQYGESATDILSSIASFKQAGFDVYEAMELTRSALDLVIAGDLEAARASEILVAALKGFGAEATEATRIIDILNAVSNEFATDVEQLGTGFAELSPIAKQAGFSFEETAGILTPVIEVFRSGSEAAIALKTGLTRLIDDAKPVRDALASIGVAQTDANGTLRSARDIFYDVSEAFVDLDEKQKLYIASTLFGRQQAARLIAVFDDLNKVQAVTQVAFDSTGSAAEEVAARLASAEVQVNRFVAGFENLAITIGNQFKVATTEAIGGATAIENTLREMVDEGTFDPIFDLINEFAGNLGENLRTIAANLPEAFENVDFSGFLDSIRDLGGEITDLFEAFFGDIDLATPEGLAEAIQKVVDAGEALTNVTAGILDAFEPFVRQLGNAVTALVDSDEATEKAVGQFLGFAKAINTVVDQFDYLVGGLNLIGGALSVLSITQLTKAVGGFGTLTTAITTAGGALASLAGGLSALGLGAAIGFTLDKYVPAFSAAADATFDWVASLLGAEKATKSNLESAQAFEAETQEVVRQVQAMTGALDTIPSEKGVDVKVEGGTEAETTFDDLMKQIEALPDLKQVTTRAEVDEDSFQAVEGIIIREIPETGVVEVIATPNAASFDEAKDTVDELPSEKLLEIKLQGEIDTRIAEIKAQAETIQTAVEWQAKLDIADVEANAKIITSAFDSIDTSIDSTGDLLSDLFGSLVGTWGTSRALIERQIDEENRRRDEALRLQTELTEAQIEYIRARTEAVEAGDAIINISAEGLEPELEAFMWQILERIKVRATEEAAEFLLGTGIT